MSPLHKILKTLTNIFYKKFVDFFYRRVTQKKKKNAIEFLLLNLFEGILWLFFAICFNPNSSIYQHFLQSTPFQQSAGEHEERNLRHICITGTTTLGRDLADYTISTSICFSFLTPSAFRSSINPSCFRTPFSSYVTVRLAVQHNFCWNIIGHPPDMRSPSSSSGQLKNLELLKRLTKNETN